MFIIPLIITPCSFPLAQVDFHEPLGYYKVMADKAKQQQLLQQQQEKEEEEEEREAERQRLDGSMPTTPKAPALAHSINLVHGGEVGGGGGGGDHTNGSASSRTSRAQAMTQETRADENDGTNDTASAIVTNNPTATTSAGNDVMPVEGQGLVPGQGKEPEKGPKKDLDHPGGSLPVPGANEDSLRIAKLITDSLNATNNTSTIDAIFVTLDTHHKLHIAHSRSWKKGRVGVGSVIKTPAKTEGKFGTPEYKVLEDAVYYKEGEAPNVFTTISHNDVKNGVWKPEKHLDEKWCVEYTRSLELLGKFQLIIWPEHCLIGTVGHSVVPCIAGALREWSKTTRKSVEYVKVGRNIRTEVYSVFKAEVYDRPSIRR